MKSKTLRDLSDEAKMKIQEKLGITGLISKEKVAEIIKNNYKKPNRGGLTVDDRRLTKMKKVK